MSNSNLVSYTRISPNKTIGRNHAIDTITIHCMVGQLSVESCGNVFANKSRQASSNYGIGYDGRIALYVDEKDRSWCSSNAANDNRAITIECASDSSAPYAIKNVVYNALIELLVDICKRNGIPKLVWSTDKKIRVGHLNGCNMTVHRDYAAKSCPGDYLYNRMGQIAADVNAKLNAPATDMPVTIPTAGGSFLIKTLDNMTIRKGPGVLYPIVKKDGARMGNVFTIIEEKNNWGKLKSGAGWINISPMYAKRL